MSFRRREMPGLSPDASQLLFAWIYACVPEDAAPARVVPQMEDGLLLDLLAIRLLPETNCCPFCELA